MALRVVVLGRGAWGSTLSGLWSRSGHAVRGWSRRDGGDAAELLPEADLVVAAVSMAGIESLARSLAPHWPSGLPLLSCSKGLDPERLCTATQLWRQYLPTAPLAVLSGPNLATELQQGLPAASVLAAGDDALARRLQSELSNNNLRLYTNADPIGVEAAGALKNVMALAAGVCDGLGLGANARASLLCRGLAELGVVVRGMGGDPTTTYGLAGLGDLLATATSALSRNYRCGLLLAEGCGEAEAIERVGATVEGCATARAVLQLAARQGWHLPICEQVVAVLAGTTSPQAAVAALMERQLKPE
ncbi:MAG: NAD(P)H-dependent glycerol-3-phosphate dehydrogenase [Synechococcus sp.]